MQKTNLIIKSEIYNDCYLPFLFNQKPYLIFYGGAGSGKSHFVAQKIIERCLTEKGHKFLVTRKVAKTLRESVYAEFLNVISNQNVESLFTCLISPMSIKCFNGSEIIFAGVDDPVKLKSIQGVTSMWMEELTEFTLQDFLQLDLRSRHFSKNYNQTILSFNPILIPWIKEMFYDEPRDCDEMLHTTFEDNLFIDQTQYHEKLLRLKQYSPEYYEVYGKGRFAIPEELIYKHWGTHRDEDVPENITTVYCIDWGFNDPFVLMELKFAGKRLFMKELVYEQHLDTDQMQAKVLQLLKGKRNNIYADPSRPDSIKALYNKGLNIKKANNAINEGIAYLQSYETSVYYESHNTIYESRNYRWDKDKDGNLLDKPIDKDNHSCFITGTKIATINGNVNIENIKVGDKVLTRKGYKKVLASWETGKTNELYQMKYDKSILIGTGDHPIYCNDNVLKPLKELMQSDILYILQDNELFPKTNIPNNQDAVRCAVEKLILKEKCPVFNLTVEDEHEYYANGILVSNCDSVRYGIYTYAMEYILNKKSSMSDFAFVKKYNQSLKNKSRIYKGVT